MKHISGAAVSCLEIQVYPELLTMGQGHKPFIYLGFFEGILGCLEEGRVYLSHNLSLERSRRWCTGFLGFAIEVQRPFRRAFISMKIDGSWKTKSKVYVLVMGAELQRGSWAGRPAPWLK